MGIYLNPGNDGFADVRRGMYIDKSGLIGMINRTIGTPEKLTCISRPRRFGKSFATQMLCAYYDRSCNSAPLFDDLEIAGDASYREHLNCYHVLYLDITNIIAEVTDRREVVPFIRRQLRREICEYDPQLAGEESFSRLLYSVVERTGCKFIAIIDEWDALIRDRKSTPEIQYEYLEFLRMLFKSSAVTNKIFAASYMTGILPIKKDGSQSAISEFRESSMLQAGDFQGYMGFTEDEVRTVCTDTGLDFREIRRWYNGYSFDRIQSIYNPYSVMEARRTKKIRSYWKMSSAADSLLDFINLDFDGLSKAVTELLGGVEIPVDVDGFQNDVVSFSSKDDVLTLLVHFGYLAYNEDTQKVRIPNEEIRIEFAKSIRKSSKTETLRRVKESDQLILNTVAMDEEAVAAQIEKIHIEECSPLHYNSEQALRSVIKLAYFTYKDQYIQMEELAGGTGYADIVYLPKPATGMPILVIELKWMEAAEGAIAQIRDRNYPSAISGYGSDILLVGISYSKEDKNKKHFCRICKAR